MANDNFVNNVFNEYELSPRIQELQEQDKPIASSQDGKDHTHMYID